MIDTQLILLEGPPGSGKSTTAHKLSDEITRSGNPCRCFFEWSPDHPIPIGDDLHLRQVIASSIEREGEMLRLWQQFAQANQASGRITVMESRFWQTGVMLTYIAGQPVEGVIASHDRVIRAIQPLKPALIYFEIEALPDFIERTIRLRDADWQQAGHPGSWSGFIFDALDLQPWSTNRNLRGLAGMVAFFEEWAAIAENLYAALPFPKIKIKNPHLNWPLAMQQMYGFLGLSV